MAAPVARAKAWRRCVDAIRQQRVDTLLLQDEPSSDLQLLGCDDPTLVAESERELAQVGATGVCTARADALVVRALAAAGARPVVVPAAGLALADGIGALLRCPTSPPGRTPSDPARGMQSAHLPRPG